MTVLNLDTYLQKFARFGVHLGLERVQRLLADLGNPQDAVPTIHVAGTNGKGSVCAYLSAILTAAGYRVGRYTSPHLLSWCERLCVNEQPIPEAAFAEVLQRVEAAIDPQEPTPTQFEVVTAAMWLYFAEMKVDVAVVEVGLGGRLDATNVCDRPLVSVITSISRDHWQRLGDTLGAIASEKAGILKPQSPAVVGPLPPEAEAVVRSRLADLEGSAVWVQPAEAISETRARYEGLEYPLPLPGDIQRLNSAIALSTIQQLKCQGWTVEDAAICQGMERARWRGRLEWVRYNGRSLLVDGAHNVASAAALRRYADSLQRPVTWVMGMLLTKDTAGILQTLLRPGDALRLVPIPGHQYAPPEDLAQQAQGTCEGLASVACDGDGKTALQRACEDGDRLPVLCGSLYLIGSLIGSFSANIPDLASISEKTGMVDAP